MYVKKVALNQYSILFEPPTILVQLYMDANSAFPTLFTKTIQGVEFVFPLNTFFQQVNEFK